MRKQNLLKLAFTMLAMIVMTGAWAQITITVKNSDGTPANGAILYTTTGGVSTTVAVDGEATDLEGGAANGVIQINPAAGAYNFIISNDGPTQWNTYGINYDGTGPVTATITLNASFEETMNNDYVAGYTGDKITLNQPMPLWVYPSPVHNPGWSAPAADYVNEQAPAAAGDINFGLSSTFTWNVGTNGTDNSLTANDNYVEVTWSTTGVKTITVFETADAAYGGCTGGNTQTFFTEVIDPPFAKINETFSTVLTLTNVIANGCAPQNKNVSVAFDNTSEEFPYFVSPTITAINYDLNGAGDALVNPTGSTVITAEDLANPISMAAAGELIAAADYNVLNDKITVYEININKWNAKISRKSDYVNIRDNSLDAALAENYTYYTAASSGQPGADVTIARIIVFPNPATGPIYHVPNSWGL